MEEYTKGLDSITGNTRPPKPKHEPKSTRHPDVHVNNVLAGLRTLAQRRREALSVIEDADERFDIEEELAAMWLLHDEILANRRPIWRFEPGEEELRDFVIAACELRKEALLKLAEVEDEDLADYENAINMLSAIANDLKGGKLPLPRFTCYLHVSRSFLIYIFRRGLPPSGLGERSKASTKPISSKDALQQLSSAVPYDSSSQAAKRQRTYCKVSPLGACQALNLSD